MKYYLVFTAVPTIGKFIILNKPGSRIPYFIANQPEGKSWRSPGGREEPLKRLGYKCAASSNHTVTNNL